MRFAYADPPYPGQAKLYRGVTDVSGVTWAGEEVDHVELATLLRMYDGFCLHTSSPALSLVLPLFSDQKVRVAAWVKPFAAYKRNVRVAYAWEPIIIKTPERRDENVPTRDFFAESITLKRGMTGAKPERLCYWLFNVMGMTADDTLHDLFPGSGAVMRAWESWMEAGCPKIKQSLKTTNELIPDGPAS